MAGEICLIIPLRKLRGRDNVQNSHVVVLVAPLARIRHTFLVIMEILLLQRTFIQVEIRTSDQESNSTNVSWFFCAIPNLSTAIFLVSAPFSSKIRNRKTVAHYKSTPQDPPHSRNFLALPPTHASSWRFVRNIMEITSTLKMCTRMSVSFDINLRHPLHAQDFLLSIVKSINSQQVIGKVVNWP